MRGTALRHIASALARLREGGRLVAIVGANCAPEAAAFRDGFVRLQEQATILFSAAIAGKIYAKHGTTTATRLLVIDKVPAADPAKLPASLGEAPDLATLLAWVTDHVPPRPAPPTAAPASAVPILLSASLPQGRGRKPAACREGRSEEHTSELQSLMRISYAVFCLKKKITQHKP